MTATSLFRMHRWRALGFACALALLAGCPRNSPDDGGNGGNGGNGGGDGVVDVEMRGLAFVPKEVTIRVGQTVRWTNRDGVLHTVTSGDPGDTDAGAAFGSGLLGQGQSFEHTFDTAGEFEYHCIPHQFLPAMRDAKVTVTP